MVVEFMSFWIIALLVLLLVDMDAGGLKLVLYVLTLCVGYVARKMFVVIVLIMQFLLVGFVSVWLGLIWPVKVASQMFSALQSVISALVVIGMRAWCVRLDLA